MWQSFRHMVIRLWEEEERQVSLVVVQLISTSAVSESHRPLLRVSTFAQVAPAAARRHGSQAGSEDSVARFLPSSVTA